MSVNLLKTIEMTNQEAAWYLLREPMSKSSIVVAYIPTPWPQERERIRKTHKELEALEGDCTDIWKENWFDKYEKRPNYLEQVTLGQFVSKYYKNRKEMFVERKKPRIIRYRHYDMDKDYNEYRREMVTLHYPFRNEDNDILIDFKFNALYDENEQPILDGRNEFESNLDIEKTLEICRL